MKKDDFTHNDILLNYVEGSYTDTERVILCDYFGIKRPEALNGLDIYKETSGIYARRARYSSEFEIPNAVARIALSRVQNGLPSWACTNSEGEILVARQYSDHENRVVELLPQYLFTINWADSGPGFSWPEAYYLTWLPEFDRYVVTASQDSPDCYGYEDIAIGSSALFPDRVGIARDIITNFWNRQRKEYDQQPWEYLFGNGLVTSEESYRWRESVWPQEIEEEE